MTVESKTTTEFTITADNIQPLTVTHDAGSSKIVIGGGRLVVSLGQAKDLVEVLKRLLHNPGVESPSKPDPPTPLKVGDRVRLMVTLPEYRGTAGNTGRVVEVTGSEFTVALDSLSFGVSNYTCRKLSRMSDFEVIG